MLLTEQWFRPHPFWHRDRRKAVVVALALNCTMAFLLTLLAQGSGRDNLIICNAAGLCMWFAASLFGWASQGKLFPWHLFFTVPLGLVAGMKLAALAGTEDVLAIIIHNPHQRWTVLGIAAVMAVSGSIFSIFFARSMSLRSAFEIEQRRAGEARQAEAAAQLALLQAQIEPHFLFNTLANVQSLIERDPATAKRMLQHLDHYLRVSLARTRKPVGTLAEEIDLVETLLAIAAIRLGPRLRYTAFAGDDVRSAPLPPLLLQPLVENALKHGIEPSVTGGEIAVHAERRGDLLHVQVSDTGVGMLATSGDGIGLSNVRARLSSLYGEQARLSLYANQPNGVIAELTVPLQ